MAPIQDFYNNEFLRTVTVQKKNNARVSPFNVIVEFISKVHFDFESNSKFISFYIPESQYAVIVCTFLLKNINDTLGITDGITTAMGHPGQDFSHSQDLQFSKRVYIYTDNIIGESERLKIREFWKQAGLSLILRDKSYAEQAEITPLERFKLICSRF